ncbi:MAG TPA: hypothetical protein VJ997_07575, partial [Longimicrobiales bacterium]|nr:hypothetical protein [Longimicrobiales bacterium]
MRAELFDTILARVERREAFSEVKNRTLGFDPLQDMRALRDTVVDADTEEALFYALTRLSHARRDRHLDVALVPGGLQIPDSAGVDVWGGGQGPERPEAEDPKEAPVRALPDYGEEGGFFVGDVADGSGVPLPSPGDRIVAVDGIPVEAWAAAVRPWIRHSHPAGLRWKTAEALSVASATLPPALRSDSLRLDVADADGATVRYALPYLPAGSLTWHGASGPRYPGLTLARSTVTWDLLVPTDDRRFLVLVWTGFRETMVADVDTLVALARREGLLDCAVIVDVTRSGGGSLGPYAVQHLQPRAFKTTLGTLRLSDVIVPFIEGKRRDFAAHDINDGGVPETVDDGSWLMDWLEHDVLAALQRGDVHTAPVPFKLAHASKDSDGVLPPAPAHFRGPFAVISGPSGGSHLDQFNAIVKDNGLGPLVGMPAGGYSNTWEWEEVLTFPGTDRPVVGFMYDIGHTIRPDGEVLEGNPAQVDEWIPLTARGAADYYSRLLDAALARLG